MVALFWGKGLALRKLILLRLTYFSSYSFSLLSYSSDLERRTSENHSQDSGAYQYPRLFLREKIAN
ncbi:MAG: hypothetical protein EU541_03440 [Promethearchaeota archaeon]|nr:MAG: hypothetical protein EU541_03440 [Candidatus Lokiarchaeota archaeon]